MFKASRRSSKSSKDSANNFSSTSSTQELVDLSSPTPVVAPVPVGRSKSKRSNNILRSQEYGSMVEFDTDVLPTSVLHDAADLKIGFEYNPRKRSLYFSGATVMPLPVHIKARYKRCNERTRMRELQREKQRVLFKGTGEYTSTSCTLMSEDKYVVLKLRWGHLQAVSDSSVKQRRRYNVSGETLDYEILPGPNGHPDEGDGEGPVRLSELWFEFGAVVNHKMSIGGGGVDNSNKASWRMFQQGFQSWAGAESYSPKLDPQKYSVLSRLGLAVHMNDTDSVLWGQKSGVVSNSVVMLHPHDCTHLDKCSTCLDNDINSNNSNLKRNSNTSTTSNNKNISTRKRLSKLKRPSFGKRKASSKSTLSRHHLTPADSFAVGVPSSSDLFALAAATDAADADTAATAAHQQHRNAEVEQDPAVEELGKATAVGGAGADDPHRRASFFGGDTKSLVQFGDVRSLLLGFTSSRVATSEFLALEQKTAAQVSIVLDYDGVPIVQEGIKGEHLVAMYGTSPQSAIDWYATLSSPMPHKLAPFSPLMKFERAPIGWSSWYQFYDRVTEEDMFGIVDVLASDPILSNAVQFVQLDDGFQPAVGDWLIANAKFPSGLEGYCARTIDAGFMPGLWLAPFICGRYSQVYVEHPSWFVRDPNNPSKHLLGVYNPDWGLKFCDHSTYILDLTHPEVLDHLEHVFASLCKMGFGYFKIDFLQAGIRRGLRFDNSMSRTQAYVAGIKRIRKAIGPQSFLLGCGAPIAPSITSVEFEVNDPSAVTTVLRSSPVFDAMRVSSDTRASWYEPKYQRYFAHDVNSPSLRRAMHGTTGRWWMSGRSWAYNDPDVMILRKNSSQLTLNEVIFQLTIIGMSGGLQVLTDDMRTLEPNRLDIALRIMPPSTLRGWALNFLQEFEPSYFACTSTDWFNSSVGRVELPRGRGAVVSVFNWKDKGHMSANLVTVWQKVLHRYLAWRDESKYRFKADQTLDVAYALTPTNAVCFFNFWMQQVISVVNLSSEDTPHISVPLVHRSYSNTPELFSMYGSSMKPPRRKMFGVGRRESLAGENSVWVSPRSAACIQVTPFSMDQPAVVGSSFHMTCLADGLLRWSNPNKHNMVLEGGCALAIRVAKIWVIFPASVSADSIIIVNTTSCRATLLRVEPVGTRAVGGEEVIDRESVSSMTSSELPVSMPMQLFVIAVELEADPKEWERTWSISISHSIEQCS